jgi:hypothetical protein
MLDKRIVDFLRSRNWWYEEEGTGYRKALEDVKIDPDSDFGQFMLHADDGPDFIWRSDTFHQLCWHVINTDYLKRVDEGQGNVFGLPGRLVQFSSFEGGGAYFYDPQSGSVLLAQLGKRDPRTSINNVSRTWETFNAFALEFFDIEPALSGPA